jgi:hypothetical protein
VLLLGKEILSFSERRSPTFAVEGVPGGLLFWGGNEVDFPSLPSLKDSGVIEGDRSQTNPTHSSGSSVESRLVGLEGRGEPRQKVSQSDACDRADEDFTEVMNTDTLEDRLFCRN